MHPVTSAYLDLVRFLAALMVVLSHAAYTRLGGEWIDWAGGLGRDAVMIFFVLSGYVIAFVVDTKEKHAQQYAISRLARIYSVALPALILTVIADRIGVWADPEFYTGFWHLDSQGLLRFMLSLAFVNEYWFESIRAFSNGPYWSLSYEVGYYVLFGLWYYARGKWQIILPAAFALILGPKILLLLPVWLIGVAAYHFNKRCTLSPALALCLFVGSWAAYAAYLYFDVAVLLLDWLRGVWGSEFVDGQLKWSRFFLSAYLLGSIVVVNFIGFHHLANQKPDWRLPDWILAPVVHLAAFTFAIYLMHYPLLHMFHALGFGSVSGLLLTLVSIYVIGTFTERKKHVWKRLFARMFDLWARMRARFVS